MTKDGKIIKLLKDELEPLMKSGINIEDKVAVLAKERKKQKSKKFRKSVYNKNLIKKFKKKKCCLCGLDIEEIIEACHIFEVSDIKNSFICEEDKLNLINSGENGLFLCPTHHKLFDKHYFCFNDKGEIIFNENLDEENIDNLKKDIKINKIDKKFLSKEFLYCLKERNKKFSIVSTKKES